MENTGEEKHFNWQNTEWFNWCKSCSGCVEGCGCLAKVLFLSPCWLTNRSNTIWKRRRNAIKSPALLSNSSPNATVLEGSTSRPLQWLITNSYYEWNFSQFPFIQMTWNGCWPELIANRDFINFRHNRGKQSSKWNKNKETIANTYVYKFPIKFELIVFRLNQKN